MRDKFLVIVTLATPRCKTNLSLSTHAELQTKHRIRSFRNLPIISRHEIIREKLINIIVVIFTLLFFCFYSLDGPNESSEQPSKNTAPDTVQRGATCLGVGLQLMAWP